VAHRTGFILRFFYSLAIGVLLASSAKAADWPRLPAETSGPAWPAVPVKAVARPAVNPFSFELGARYWYSIATTTFAFTNGHPFFGDPTSTIDWNDMEGHSGEIFGRFEHRPSGYFVKGLVGGGKIVGGEMIDRDFLTGGFKFSDTTSNVGGDNFKFAMVDVGVSRELPALGLRGGAFVGYHYWAENLTAFGVRCNVDDAGGFFCGPPGSVRVPFDVPVMVYKPTWHAVRLGFDWRMNYGRWSFSGDVAGIPYAKATNDDSHLLRQDPTDLGPAPNIITQSRWAVGAEVDLFVNYALTPNLEVGTGFRYWGLFAQSGRVDFGPGFGQGFELRNLEQQRYGLLVQLKGKL
jgi:hypothetical protein